MKSNMQFVNLASQDDNANFQDANSNPENVKPFVQEIKFNLHEIKTNPLFIKSNTRMIKKIEIEHKAIAVKLDPKAIADCDGLGRFAARKLTSCFVCIFVNMHGKHWYPYLFELHIFCPPLIYLIVSCESCTVCRK